MADRPGTVSIVGLHGGQWFGSSAGEALRAARVVIGAARHLAALPEGVAQRTVAADGPLGEVLDQVAARRDAGEDVCLLASGDPGFFGVARLAHARLGAGLRVHPAPSSVALAFAHLGMSWDDAAVVSAHGRDLDPACRAVLAHPKVAVLVSPAAPPEAVGRRLAELGCPPREAAVVSRIGEAAESVWEGGVEELAAGSFDPLSVVLLVAPGAGTPPAPGWAWGLPEEAYAHREGMITKAEVRSVALGKLRLPALGVLWDVGAGSGSVAAECARLSPGLRVFAVERRPDDVARLRENLAGTGATVVHGAAPAALAGLPDPDRVFVGGGGVEVLDAVLSRLRPGGTVVATYAALDRAAAGARRLGRVVQISVSRGVPTGDPAAFRLAAENPVFVCWGPG